MSNLAMHLVLNDSRVPQIISLPFIPRAEQFSVLRIQNCGQPGRQTLLGGLEMVVGTHFSVRESGIVLSDYQSLSEKKVLAS